MKIGNCLTSLALAATMLTGTGCFKKKVATEAVNEKAGRYSLSVASGAILNPDFQGNAMSVVVRVYHLRDKAEFSKLTFEMLSSEKTDKELLGQDFLGSHELVLVPGGNYNTQLDLPSGTRYVGAMAFFRSPDANFWRVLVDTAQFIDPKAKKKKNQPPAPLQLKVEGNSLFVQNVPLELIPGQPAPKTGPVAAPAEKKKSWYKFF